MLELHPFQFAVGLRVNMNFDEGLTTAESAIRLLGIPACNLELAKFYPFPTLLIAFIIKIGLEGFWICNLVQRKDRLCPDWWHQIFLAIYYLGPIYVNMIRPTEQALDIWWHVYIGCSTPGNNRIHCSHGPCLFCAFCWKNIWGRLYLGSPEGW